MAFTINGTTGLTFPDATTQTTRAVSRSGDTMTGALAVTDRVSVGNPPLQYGAGGALGAEVSIQSSTTTNSALSLQAGLSRFYVGTKFNDNRLFIGGNGGSFPTDHGIVINTSNHVNMPSQPCMFAQGNSGTNYTYGAGGRITNMTTDGTAGSFAQGITHNAGVFTVPIAGKYMWTWTYYDNDGSTTSSRIGIRHNGTQRGHVHLEMTNGQGSGTVILNMSANDYVDFFQIYNTGIYMGADHWYCTGQLIA